MKSVLLVAAGLLLPAGLALAQPPVAGDRDARHARHQQDEAQRRQEETRDLAIVLGLKPAQQPALATWLAAMHPPEEMRQPRPEAGGQPATTPQLLADRQAHLAERQQFEQSRLAATKTFYATLDGRQQQVFDALDRLRHDHGHDHKGHGHGPDRPTPPPGA